MSHKVNLVRVLTAATGNSTPITLGTAYSQLFMTPAEAGAMNGRVYTYLIVDGNDWELGKGVYTSSGTTLARTTVLASRISGTLGTTRISLSGTAQVRFVESAEDMDGLRGTRVVTGTSDVIANSDQGYTVTYSNAASIAVTLAQAAVSNLFIDGWKTTVQNLGAGTVTITPATSTINGGSTLVLAQNMGALIWSDGTNYHAAFMPVTKPLLAGNNLSDLASATTAQTNLGGTTVGKALFTAADAAAARTAIGAAIDVPLPNYLTGLTLSAAGSTATFGVAAGFATDSTNTVMMALGSAFTKTTGAWVQGTGNGALDTGTIANNTWYHAHLIEKTDKSAADVTVSLSVSAPTLQAGWTYARRIGSMKTDGSAQWTAFVQKGDLFLWVGSKGDVSSVTLGTTSTLYTLSVPTGVQVIASLRALINGASSFGLISSPDEGVLVGNTPSGNISLGVIQTGSMVGELRVRTNTSGQIRAVCNQNTTFSVSTAGWADDRGKL